MKREKYHTRKKKGCRPSLEIPLWRGLAAKRARDSLAPRKDNLPASAHVIGSSGVGILKYTDVEVYADDVLVDAVHLEWHKIGNGISEDRIVTCTNVIPQPGGVVIHAHNTLVFPPGSP